MTYRYNARSEGVQIRSPQREKEDTPTSLTCPVLTMLRRTSTNRDFQYLQHLLVVLHFPA